MTSPRKKEKRVREIGLVDGIERDESRWGAGGVEAGGVRPGTDATIEEWRVVVHDQGCEVGAEVVEIKETGWRGGLWRHGAHFEGGLVLLISRDIQMNVLRDWEIDWIFLFLVFSRYLLKDHEIIRTSELNTSHLQIKCSEIPESIQPKCPWKSSFATYQDERNVIHWNLLWSVLDEWDIEKARWYQSNCQPLLLI
jgi:hypothetical protein